MTTKKILFLLTIFLFKSITSLASEDEISFFNVGQGHCTLVHTVGKVPLLIDAGSNQNVTRVLKYQANYEGAAYGEKVINSIVAKVIKYWSNDNINKGKLNVIVTHGDIDHHKYVPVILNCLAHYLTQINFYTNFRILLGGIEKKHYSANFLNFYNPQYSSKLIRINTNDQFLNDWGKDSGCITHLFCPIGNNNENSWSIIARVILNQRNNSYSAILTGDADKNAQRQMLFVLGPNRKQEILSDILLYPHHGAEELNYEWIKAVNPQAVVISAGNHRGYKHPQANALMSLFPSLHLYDKNTLPQIQNLSLNNTANPPPFPAERLWNVVDSHQIVYYDPENQLSEKLKKIFPTFSYPFPCQTDSPYFFNDKPWYITLDKEWQCATLNFPIYTTFTSGTMTFKKNILNLNTFDIEFSDIPTDTEKMAQVILGNFIDEDEEFNRVGNLLDDRGGDYDDLFSLSAQSIENSFEALQLFLKKNPYRLRENSLKHAEEIFFLSFNIIPIIETNGQKMELKNFRDTYLAEFINYFRDVTTHIAFEEDEERRFFNSIIDLLFADASHYKNFELSKNFNDRIRIFDSFIRSPHFNEKERRENYLYLYCLIYKKSPLHHHLFYHPYMSNVVEELKSIPYNGLETLLDRIQYIYYQCRGNQDYFNLPLTQMPSLVRTIYTLNLRRDDVEIIGDFLSWFPYNFNVPISTTIHAIASFCPLLKKLKVNTFTNFSQKLGRELSYVPNNQLEKLNAFLNNNRELNIGYKY